MTRLTKKVCRTKNQTDLQSKVWQTQAMFAFVSFYFAKSVKSPEKRRAGSWTHAKYYIYTRKWGSLAQIQNET